MRTRATKVVTAAMLGLAVLMMLHVTLPPAGPLRRPCGHLDDSFTSVSGFKDFIVRKPHLCTGDRVMLDLKMFQSAQGSFQNAFQRPGADLAELAPYAEWVQRRSYPLYYRNEDGRWSLAVGKIRRLPGYYLLTMDGKVFFDEFRPATTNDLCLRQ